MRLTWLVLLSMIISGCSGFYRVHNVQLNGVQPIHVAYSSSRGGKIQVPANAQPYLSISASGDTQAFDLWKSTTERSLQIFKLDVNYKFNGREVGNVVMAYDIINGQELAANGLDIMKRLPINPASNTTVDLVVKSSAIEKNVADKFIDGLQVVQQVAGVAGAAMGNPALSPAAAEALGAATKVLDKFKSSDKTTTSERIMSLNSDSDDLRTKPKAYILIPTGGKSDGPIDATAAQDATEQAGSSSQIKTYLQRVTDIDKKTFSLCSTNSNLLCTKKANGNETQFKDYAYLILKPSQSHRLAISDFLWRRIVNNGPCDVIDANSVKKYARTLEDNASLLTDDQLAYERAVLSITQKYLDLSVAFVSNDMGKAFSIFRSTYDDRYEYDWMFPVIDSAGISYEQAMLTVNSCILKTSKKNLYGVFETYDKYLKLIRVADDINDEANHDLIVSKINIYEKALPAIIGLSEQLAAIKVNSPYAIGIIGYDQKRIEKALYDLEFKPSIDKAMSSEAVKKNQGVQELKQLWFTSSCEPCKQKAKNIVGDFQLSVAETKLSAAMLKLDQLSTMVEINSIIFEENKSSTSLQRTLLQDIQGAKKQTENAIKTNDKILAEDAVLQIKKIDEQLKTLNSEIE